jgi:hypothetical protein
MFTLSGSILLMSVRTRYMMRDAKAFKNEFRDWYSPTQSDCTAMIFLSN